MSIRRSSQSVPRTPPPRECPSVAQECSLVPKECSSAQRASARAPPQRECPAAPLSCQKSELGAFKVPDDYYTLLAKGTQQLQQGMEQLEARTRERLDALRDSERAAEDRMQTLAQQEQKALERLEMLSLKETGVSERLQQAFEQERRQAERNDALRDQEQKMLEHLEEAFQKQQQQLEERIANMEQPFQSALDAMLERVDALTQELQMPRPAASVPVGPQGPPRPCPGKSLSWTTACPPSSASSPQTQPGICPGKPSVIVKMPCPPSKSASSASKRRYTETSSSSSTSSGSWTSTTSSSPEWKRCDSGRRRRRSKSCPSSCSMGQPQVVIVPVGGMDGSPCGKGSKGGGNKDNFSDVGVDGSRSTSRSSGGSKSTSLSRASGGGGSGAVPKGGGSGGGPRGGGRGVIPHPGIPSSRTACYTVQTTVLAPSGPLKAPKSPKTCKTPSSVRVALPLDDDCAPAPSSCPSVFAPLLAAATLAGNAECRPAGRRKRSRQKAGKADDEAVCSLSQPGDSPDDDDDDTFVVCQDANDSDDRARDDGEDSVCVEPPPIILQGLKTSKGRSSSGSNIRLVECVTVPVSACSSDKSQPIPRVWLAADCSSQGSTSTTAASTSSSWCTTEQEQPADLVGASKDGRTEAVRALLARGADARGACDPEGNTALHWAAWNVNPVVTQLLLNAGADPNARNSLLHTPLHWAASYDYAGQLTGQLLAAGAQPCARDRNGGSPLHWAARRNNEAGVRALLGAGASPDALDAQGNSPVSVAANDSIRGLLCCSRTSDCPDCPR